MSPVSEYGGHGLIEDPDRCPTPEFHTPDRTGCSYCVWKPTPQTPIVHVRYEERVDRQRDVLVSVHETGTVKSIAKALREKAEEFGHEVSSEMGGNWTGDDPPRALWWTEHLRLEDGGPVYTWFHAVTVPDEPWIEVDA